MTHDPRNDELPRYFTPTQPLEMQKRIFEHLCTHGTDAARVQLFTPELAEWILTERNSSNRHPSEKKVAEYTEALKDGEWPVTGATIIFAKNGRLLDGQHRLLAVWRSGVAMRTYAVFGVDQGAFTLIDIGRKRTNLDVFEVAGIHNGRVVAKANRWLRILTSADPTNRSLEMSNSEALAWFRANVDDGLMQACVQWAIPIEKTYRMRGLGNLLPAGPLAALLYRFCDSNPRRAERFANELRGQERWGKSLRLALEDAMRRNHGVINDNYRNALVILAWNYFDNRPNRGMLEWDFGLHSGKLPAIAR